MLRQTAILMTALMLGAPLAHAQSPRLLQAREALPQPSNAPIELVGERRALAAFADGVWLFDTATLAVVRKYDAGTGAEMFPAATRARQPVLSMSGLDGARTLIDPETGGALLSIDAAETLILVARTDRGLLALSDNGAIDDRTGKDEPHRFIARQAGRDTQVVNLELGPSRAARPSPRAAISHDGALVALVHVNVLRFIDVATGAVERIETPSDEKIIHVAFAPIGNRVVLLTEKGPLIELDRSTRKITRRIPAPELPRRWEITAHGKGDVIEIEGRRQRAIVDVTSGTSIEAARAGSGTGFMLTYVGGDIALRAAKGRATTKHATYGVYRREAKGFRLLYKHDLAGLSLGLMAVSPNLACLFLGTKDHATIRDVQSHRELQTMAMPAGFDNLRFTSDGRAILGVDADNRVTSIAAPKACAGGAAPSR